MYQFCPGRFSSSLAQMDVVSWTCTSFVVQLVHPSWLYPLSWPLLSLSLDLSLIAFCLLEGPSNVSINAYLWRTVHLQWIRAISQAQWCICRLSCQQVSFCSLSPSSLQRFCSEHEVVRIFARSTGEVSRLITCLDTGLGLPLGRMDVTNVFIWSIV